MSQEANRATATTAVHDGNGDDTAALYRHSVTYMWGRGIPSLISFAAIAIHTRLITPSEFGQYALVVATTLFANATLFQWLRLSLLRFLPGSEDSATQLKAAASAFMAVSIAAVGVSAILLLVLPHSTGATILLGTALLISHAWFELNNDVLRAFLTPARSGIASLARASVSLALGAALALIGLGSRGLLIGLIAGNAAAVPLFHKWIWSTQRRPGPTSNSIGRLVKYGLPLAIGLSLGFIIRGSDRLMLGWMSGPASVGTYAAGYDLAQSSLEVLMAIVHTAAFPLAAAALARHGVEAARQQLSRNLSLLAAVAVPAAVGLIFVAPNLTHVLLGEAFRRDAAMLIPWASIGVLLSGLRAYYVDHAFQLGKRTSSLVLVLLVGAMTNVVLNAALIPDHGVMGAAYATVAAYAISLMGGIVAARRAFPLPLPALSLAKTLGAATIMGAVLYALPTGLGPLGLIQQVFVGAGTYVAAMLAVDAMGMRTWLRGLAKSVRVRRRE